MPLYIETGITYVTTKAVVTDFDMYDRQDNNVLGGKQQKMV